jgi:hypothetical protein
MKRFPDLLRTPTTVGTTNKKTKTRARTTLCIGEASICHTFAVCTLYTAKCKNNNLGYSTTIGRCPNAG